MKLRGTLVFFFSLLVTQSASGQFQGVVYHPDSSVKVYAYGQQKTLAWCGGFDNPQFSLADLNKDGIPDLVVFERDKGVKTFLNEGTAGNPKYVYVPDYEVNFPPVRSYMILADYNCDGIPDLFHLGYSAVGFDVYTGYYNSSKQLCFTHYKQLYFNNTGSGEVNVYVNPGDIPAVVDIDGDGDLDFVSFDGLSGNWIYMYKNMQVEKKLPCDSIVTELWTSCWGKAYQPIYTYEFNMCDASMESTIHHKRTHTGNALCVLDYDGDGDMDLLDGSVGNSNIVYVQNGRIPYGATVDSMVYQDSTWPSAGHIAYLPQWPAAFNLDINQDGKKDLLISPNWLGENYKCIFYYKNTGTATVPNFVYQSDTFLVDQTIDIGTGAYPMFYDYDKDGKPDLFIGSDGYYQTATGTLLAKMAYYRNTSTTGNPSFTLVTNNFLSLDSFGYKGIAPTIGDIDNDGKADLLIGHSDGTISFFKNMATSDTVQPLWVLSQVSLKNNTGAVINTGGNATPFVYDLDKDGKPDLISGSYSGKILYYRNTSPTVGTVSLTLTNRDLGEITVDSSLGSPRYSVPFIGKIDNTEKDYLLVGSNSGSLYRYDGFQSGDTTNSGFVLIDSSYSYIDSSWQIKNNRYRINPIGQYDGLRSAPAIADVDGDGKYEMVLGEVMGGLKFYKQLFPAAVNTLPDAKTGFDVRVFPNPASGVVHVAWSSNFAQGNIEVSIINTLGQQIAAGSYKDVVTAAQISLGNITSGVYYVIVRSGYNIKTIPLSIMK